MHSGDELKKLPGLVHPSFPGRAWRARRGLPGGRQAPPGVSTKGDESSRSSCGHDSDACSAGLSGSIHTYSCDYAHSRLPECLVFMTSDKKRGMHLG